MNPGISKRELDRTIQVMLVVFGLAPLAVLVAALILKKQATSELHASTIQILVIFSFSAISCLVKTATPVCAQTT